MICDVCKGSGLIRESVYDSDTHTLLSRFVRYCFTCGGCGIAHCCDGDRADCYLPEPDQKLKALPKS
jgi:hypothetical protein